ncbi:hypothetical protein Ga0061063_0102 [Gulbenkiania indica]|uniref:OriT recognition protein n=1 Tax=Gulbenkiania indica TaxID=375574 RepID=A0A0K6H8K2_9NEIS|nr:hypothetical protein Ga0061063_0102 [Gulbenkiania indica]
MAVSRHAGRPLYDTCRNASRPDLYHSMDATCSALRFSQDGSFVLPPRAGGGVCSLLSSSFQGGVARVPFVCIGDEPLTAKLALRLQPDERDALRAEADARGVSMSALVRDLYFGAPVVSDVNRELVAELIRLGAVVRSAWDAAAASQSPYFPPLAEAIVDLQKFARTLAGKIKPSRVRHDRAADVVEFVGKSDGVALEAIVTLRLLPAEKDQLALDAEMAGITPGALVRRRIFGRPVSANINRVMQRRIRSLMAMLQHFLAEHRSRDYPEIYTTRSVLAALFKRMGHDLKAHS